MADRERSFVERRINRLKQFWAVATRHNKRADVYRPQVGLAAILLWF